jgi:hypothetical protein
MRGASRFDFSPAQPLTSLFRAALRDSELARSARTSSVFSHLYRQGWSDISIATSLGAQSRDSTLPNVGATATVRRSVCRRPGSGQLAAADAIHIVLRPGREGDRDGPVHKLLRGVHELLHQRRGSPEAIAYRDTPPNANQCSYSICYLSVFLPLGLRTCTHESALIQIYIIQCTGIRGYTRTWLCLSSAPPNASLRRAPPLMSRLVTSVDTVPRPTVPRLRCSLASVSYPAYDPRQVVMRTVESPRT